MPPTYDYRDADGNITDITDYFRLYELEVSSNAEEGSVATSQVTAYDTDATLTMGGHRRFSITEDTATGSNTTIFVGYTAERDVHRGEDSDRVQNARVWDISLVDLNSVLPRRIMRGSDAKRPRETDVARVQWLLGTNEMALIDDNLYVSTANPVMMDAVDFIGSGQTCFDILDDCAQASGKNWFVWYREETGEYSLWYDVAESTAYSSPLRLSNVLSDIDGTWTFAVSQDTSLRRDPSRVFSGAQLVWDGGRVYQVRDDTATVFARRDATVPAGNVKTVAQAEARTARYLEDMSTEEDVITTTVVLPAAKINFIMQGMRVRFRASHLPGYETFTWLRVLNRTVTQTSEESYSLRLELSAGNPASIPPEQDLSATLHIGSAAFLGLGADREWHFASDVGATLPTLVVGRQYRLVATVLICLWQPDALYNHLANGGAAVTLPGVDDQLGLPTYSWDEPSGPPTLAFEGASWSFISPLPGGYYRDGVTLTGEWSEYLGPPVQVDIALHGQPLSGYYGFEWSAILTLESRATP